MARWTVGDLAHVHTQEEHEAECVKQPHRCPCCLQVVDDSEHWWEVPASHRCPPEAMAALNRALGLED